MKPAKPMGANFSITIGNVVFIKECDNIAELYFINSIIRSLIEKNYDMDMLKLQLCSVDGIRTEFLGV